MRVRVAGILIGNDRLLMIAHKKKKEIYWLLPGGGVNFGESLEDALKREFFEELNIGVEVNEPALICDSIDPGGKRHILNICFRCNYNGGIYTIGRERRLHDFAFFEKKDLMKIRIFPPINRHLQSIMEMKKQPLYLGKIWLN